MHRTGFSHVSIGAFETSEKANGIPTLRHANLAALRGIRHRDRPTGGVQPLCGTKSTEQSLSTFRTNKEMGRHCQTRPSQ
jgi:hypothetical protein